MALKQDCITLQKVALDEEIFVIRAADLTAPKVVVEWIGANIYNPSMPDAKLREALETALRMRHYTPRKAAD